MELRHLRYFAMVATELSFRRAAERLHITQPALSRQIKDLEADVGVALLDRNTTRVRLTDAGRLFLEEVQGILLATARAAELAREAGAGRAGRLAVGNIGPITAAFMPAALTAFHTRHPLVAITLAEIEPAAQIAAVDEGRIQVGFTVEPGPELPATLRADVVLRSPMRAIVGAKHRLARSKRIPLRELGAHKMLCFAGHHAQTHTDLVRAIFTRSQLTCPTVAIVAGFESLLAMIASGQGVSIMPQHVIASAHAGLRVIVLEETSPDLVFTISAVWRDNPGSELAAQFVRQLGETLNS